MRSVMIGVRDIVVTCRGIRIRSCCILWGWMSVSLGRRRGRGDDWREREKRIERYEEWNLEKMSLLVDLILCIWSEQGGGGKRVASEIQELFARYGVKRDSLYGVPGA